MTETDVLMVRVDADLMKQAILNLVINGVQSMTAGGTLTLAAQTRRRNDSRRSARPGLRHSRPKRRRKFSNFTSPPRATKAAAESASRKPTRSCSGITAPSNSIPSSEPEPLSACGCPPQQQNPIAAKISKSPPERNRSASVARPQRPPRFRFMLAGSSPQRSDCRGKPDPLALTLRF